MWPAGLAAAAVFTASRRHLLLVLLLVLVLASLTFVLGGRPPGLALGGGIGVAVEAWVVATILAPRGRAWPRLRNDGDLLRYVAAVTAGAVAAALISMTALALVGGGSLALIGLGVLVGHASSALFLLPFFMETASHGAVAGPVERVSQWATTLAVSVLVFLPDNIPAVLFMIFPVLAWAALRSPLREVQLQVQPGRSTWPRSSAPPATSSRPPGRRDGSTCRWSSRTARCRSSATRTCWSGSW